MCNYIMHKYIVTMTSTITYTIVQVLVLDVYILLLLYEQTHKTEVFTFGTNDFTDSTYVYTMEKNATYYRLVKLLNQ